MDRAETGRRGEHAAALYYIRRGCTLLEHNYRIREGEIDLILQDPEGTVIFCEVKTRANRDAVCRPAASVTPDKRRRDVRAAAGDLREGGRGEGCGRVGGAEVTPLDRGRWMVHIIKRAFDASAR